MLLFLKNIFFLPFLEKKRYRESYISDDLDLDPQGSESSPGLSRRSTSSSGIEADTRQHSISTEMASMEEEVQRQAEKCFRSVASHGSSGTSGFDAGSKARIEDEEWQEEGGRIFILRVFYILKLICVSSASTENTLYSYRAYELFLIQLFIQIIWSSFPESKTSVGKEVVVDDPNEMFQLADLLEGVSVDCSELSSETPTSGGNNLIVNNNKI